MAGGDPESNPVAWGGPAPVHAPEELSRQGPFDVSRALVGPSCLVIGKDQFQMDSGDAEAFVAVLREPADATPAGARAPVRHRFPMLRGLATWYTTIALFYAVGSALGAVALLTMSLPETTKVVGLIVIVVLVVPIILSVLLLSECVRVVLAIEENTRLTAEREAA
jgi:hypothetical protein